jgi:hypothetical protein
LQFLIFNLRFAIAGLRHASGAVAIANLKSKIADQKWRAATVMLRALRFKKPLHHFNACSPNPTRMAELNRRSQACEVLAVTGIRVAIK